MVRWQVTVDRFEGRLAVLIPIGRPEARFLLDSGLLPVGLGEGSVLDLSIELNPGAGEAGRREISKLQKDLESESP